MSTRPRENSWELCATHAAHSQIITAELREGFKRLHHAMRQRGVGSLPSPRCILCQPPICAMVLSMSAVGQPLAFGKADAKPSPRSSEHRPSTSAALSRDSYLNSQASERHTRYPPLDTHTSLLAPSGYQPGFVEDGSVCSTPARVTEAAGDSESWTPGYPQIQGRFDSGSEDTSGHNALTRTMSGTVSEHNFHCSMPSPNL